MSAKVRHLVPTESGTGDSNNLAADLKLILDALVDLAAKTLSAQGHKLVLNEIATVEELAQKFKIPESTIIELARRGKLRGAFRVGKHWRFCLDTLRTSLATTDDVEPDITF